MSKRALLWRLVAAPLILVMLGSIVGCGAVAAMLGYGSYDGGDIDLDLGSSIITLLGVTLAVHQAGSKQVGTAQDTGTAEFIANVDLDHDGNGDAVLSLTGDYSVNGGKVTANLSTVAPLGTAQTTESVALNLDIQDSEHLSGDVSYTRNGDTYSGPGSFTRYPE